MNPSSYFTSAYWTSAYWGNRSQAVQPVPVVAPSAGGGYPYPRLRPAIAGLPYRQHAVLRTFTEPDRFTILCARQKPIQRVSLVGIEDDDFPVLEALPQTQLARLHSLTDDSIGRMKARRGLPNRHLLAWFLREAA